MEERKPIFNLHLLYEDALENARRFMAANKTVDGKELTSWEDPRDIYGQRMTIRTDEFYPTKMFDKNLREMYQPGTVEVEAKAALLWLIDRHKGFNCLELNQVIVGQRCNGIGGDKEVAIFAYISREDDMLRDFITEKALALTM